MGELFLMENCVYPAEPGWGGVSRRGGGSRNSLMPGSSVQVVLKQWEVKGLDKILTRSHQGFPSGSEGKESACHAGDLGSVPGSGRSSGEGNVYPLQYSFLENSMNWRVLRATFHGVSELDTTEQLTHSLHFSTGKALASHNSRKSKDKWPYYKTLK